MQIIVQGKTDAVLLPMKSDIESKDFEDWEYTYSSNHWSNLETMKTEVTRVAVPL